jgi:pyocin large subunit-like protein
MSFQSKGKGKKPHNSYPPRYRVKAPGVIRAAMVAVFLFLLLAPAFSQVSSLPDTGSASQSASSVTRPDIGFATPKKLSDHYQKHGREFGEITRKEYLRLAQELRDRPAGGEILEAVRKDGVITRFDRKSGAFLACNPDGTIRTFFKPNDGERYFRRQARRK